MKIHAIASAILLLTAPMVTMAQAQNDRAPSETPKDAPLEAAAEVDTQATAVTDVAAQREKKICRTERMTGSLTRSRRTCMTRSEWDRLAEGTREGVDDIVDDAQQRDLVTRAPGSF